jgi:hypothetical protein
LVIVFPNGYTFQKFETIVVDTKQSQPAFKLSDIGWLLAIGIIMANSNIWEWLSPRAEIGKVAVLWLPNAVILVALLRNWGRLYFCALAVAIFYCVGLYPSFANGSELSSLLYLTIDLVEVFVLCLVLIRWGGRNFRIASGLDATIFGAAACLACIVGSLLAAFVSEVPTGASPIAQNAPLQVGVAWFMSDLATYFFLAAPMIALSGRDWKKSWDELMINPAISGIGGILVLVLTMVGYALPQWLAAKTGLAPGAGGLLLIAFPVAAYLATTRGAAAAALAGAAIGIPSIYATVAGIGPFGKGKISADVFDMQATLVVSTFTLLLIAGMAEQLRERSRILERALDQAMKHRVDEL